MEENILNTPMAVQLINEPESQEVSPEGIEPSDPIGNSSATLKPDEDNGTENKAQNVFESIVKSSLKISDNSEKKTNIQPIYPGLINRGEILVLKAIAGAGATWFAIALAVALSKVSALFSHFEYATDSNLPLQV